MMRGDPGGGAVGSAPPTDGLADDPPPMLPVVPAVVPALLLPTVPVVGAGTPALPVGFPKFGVTVVSPGPVPPGTPAPEGGTPAADEGAPGVDVAVPADVLAPPEAPPAEPPP